LNSRKILFGYVVDYSGIPFLAYTDGTLDLASKCLSKAFECAGNSAASPVCPRNHMNGVCLAQLNDQCSGSGLYNLIDKTRPGNDHSVYPPECDSSMLGLKRNSKEFYGRCFNWIAGMFFYSGVTVNTNTFLNLDQSISAGGGQRRILQAASNITSSITISSSNYTNSTGGTNATATNTTPATLPSATPIPNTNAIGANTNITSISSSIDMISDSDPTMTDAVAMMVAPTFTPGIKPSSIIVDGVVPEQNITQKILLEDLQQVNTSVSTTIQPPVTTTTAKPAGSTTTNSAGYVSYSYCIISFLISFLLYN
jgi:hypothetical protein